MAELFNNKPGIVAVLVSTTNDDNPFRMTIDGFPGDGSQSGIIVTELAIQRHGNFQFLHTLKDLVYVYSFGERIGTIRASGLAFARLCNGTQGLSAVLEYYEANRLENRSDPISIAIGTSGSGRFRGFLTELNADVARPEARIAQFGLQFHTLPSAKPPPPAPTPTPTPPTPPTLITPVTPDPGFTTGGRPIGATGGSPGQGGGVGVTTGGRPTTATGAPPGLGSPGVTGRMVGVPVPAGALTIRRADARRPRQRVRRRR